MADSTLAALPSAGTITGAELVYVVKAGNDAQTTTAAVTNGVQVAIDDHLAETDPSVHTAAKISYSGTVSAADVQGAIDNLDSSKADATTAFTPQKSVLGPNSTYYEAFELFESVDAVALAATGTNAGGTKAIALLSGTGAAITPITDSDAVAGSTIREAQVDTGTTTTGRGGLFMYPTAVVFNATTSDLTFGCRVAVGTLSTGGETHEVRVGFCNTTAATAPTNAIFFRLQNGDTNWKAVTSNAGTSTVTDSGVAAVANAYVNLKVVYAPAGNATFYINGSQVASHSTNKPANGTALNNIVQIVKSAGTTTRPIYVAAMHLKVPFDSNLEQI